MKKQKYFLALDFFAKALNIYDSLSDKRGVARNSGNIGGLYLKLNQFQEAEKYLQRSLFLSDSLKITAGIKQCNENLSELYERTGKLQLALEHYKKFVAARDTLQNEDNVKKQTQIEMKYEFDKKEAILKEQQEKERAVAEEKNRKQVIVSYSIGGGLLLVLVFAGFIFRSLSVTRKQKQIIELKNEETEKQKMIIEEKNKDILDSIYYARRIQKNLLPTEKHINKTLIRLNKN